MDLEVDLGGIFLHNDTFNYEDYVAEDDCNPSGLAAVGVLYYPALIVGLLGNGLLLWILALKRQCWTLTDIIVLQLSLADVLLLPTLPLWALQATQAGWSFGTPLCKLSGILFNVNFYCGMFLLLSITLDRYMSIVHTTQVYSRKKPRLAYVSFLLVWLLSLLLSIPDLIFLKARRNIALQKSVCDHNNYALAERSESAWQLLSRLPHHLLGFLLPVVVLIFCFTAMLLQLQRSSQELRRHRAVKVVLTVVVVFLLCWTPYNFALMVDTFQGGSDPPSDPHQEPCATKVALTVTAALGCFHACLRPLLYAGLCTNIRGRALELLRSFRRPPPESRDSLWELGVGDEALPAKADEKVMLNQINTVQLQQQQLQQQQLESTRS